MITEKELWDGYYEAQKLKEQIERSKGPGTPYARFEWIMEEMEKRFPNPDPYSSARTTEDQFFRTLDAHLAKQQNAVAVLMRQCERASADYDKMLGRAHVAESKLSLAQDKISDLESELRHVYEK